MGRYIVARRIAAGVTTAAALGALSASARADTCGSTNAGWNAPNGAVVIEHAGGGPTVGIITALGEWGTHSMLSHGPDASVTHAIAGDPTIAQDCDFPIDRGWAKAAGPGLEIVGQGAIHTVLYGDGTAPVDNGPNLGLWYQSGITYTPPNLLIPYTVDTGPIVGNYDPSWGNDHGDQISTYQDWQGEWLTNFSFDIQGQLGGTAPIYFGWNQYMNSSTTPQGVPGYNFDTGFGVVCSTSLAMWQHDALWNQYGYTGDVIPRSYSFDVTLAAGSALHNNVHDRCSGGTTVDLGNWNNGFNVLQAGYAAYCSIIGKDICENAGNEMVNCILGNCDTNNSNWGWGLPGAYSISDDDIGCWNGNGTGAPCTGSGSSVWGWDVMNPVQWNSGGSDYSCWM
jgi:hypothetical protein